MSLLNSFLLKIRGHDSTRIFLLSSENYKDKYLETDTFTVCHKEKSFELDLAFGYLDDDYVERGEFEDIHKNVGESYSRETENAWYKWVGVYVANVVRLWILIKELEPIYNDFQITSITFDDLSADLSEDEYFVLWVESVVMDGRDIEDIEDALTEYEEFTNREREKE